MVTGTARSGADPDHDQQDMPGEGVDGKRSIAVMHAGSIEEGEDAAKQPVIHEKCKQYAAYAGGGNPWEDQADVHRDAA